MDDLIEVFLEPIINFIIYGSMNTAEDKRAPYILRVLAAHFIGILFFGLPVGVLIYGIVKKEIFIIWGGVFLLVVMIPIFIYVWRYERHDD
jgi:hypothetical protein